ncbi:ATP-binding protein [Solimicrobium silvestre]|uniref:ATPase family associated with various cellular activities (AAA) n=1 Tax=Solimicrobium silvestre TaxID=2099400 RepID=A0A2S9H0E5_9BURK|nr:ATP-binding protein [Solimicrobium silvestre]PRC93455.1 ATPase family associated with various cellular activities (AAA) [Solimicrobium silvestre]
MTDHINTDALEREITWFSQVCDARFDAYFKQSEFDIDLETLCPAPALNQEDSPYAQIVGELKMNYAERIVLMLALMPHVRPQALDLFSLQNSALGRPYSEIGGWRGKSHIGFLPTCETASFILVGNNLSKRFMVARLFKDDHFFTRQGIIKLDHQANGEPFFDAALQLSYEYLQRLADGEVHKPDFSANFPAKLMQTQLNWSDLVLNPDVMDEVENIVTWLRNPGHIIENWGLGKSLKPGYRTMFYGPPGTGKTLTASLIGKIVGSDVYRIDLSMVVSKYIGETEKNLANVFDQAQNKNWILFFDEADSLFGKRTQASSSNDRHANQETSYLLQRVEDFPGVVILATNLKANIDAAFSRRFQSEVYFAMPDALQRERLWHGLFAQTDKLDKDVNFHEIAERYELAGGALLNVARYAAIRAVRNQRDVINQEDLLAGIGRELMKDGKTL